MLVAHPVLVEILERVRKPAAANSAIQTESRIARSGAVPSATACVSA